MNTVIENVPKDTSASISLIGQRKLTEEQVKVISEHHKTEWVNRK